MPPPPRQNKSLIISFASFAVNTASLKLGKATVIIPNSKMTRCKQCLNESLNGIDNYNDPKRDKVSENRLTRRT